MRPAIEVWEDAFRTWDDAPINPARIGDEDRAAAAVIEAYAAEREAAAHAKAVAEIVAELRRNGSRVASISTPRMETDNLAITLCSAFDNPDQANDDDTGWSPDATEGCDEVIAGIVNFFANHIEAKFGGRDG